MNFKEIHAVVKELGTDKEGYVSIAHLMKQVLGHQSKFIIQQLTPNHPALYMLQCKGSNADPSHWKIHSHDSIEFMLRVMDIIKDSNDLPEPSAS